MERQLLVAVVASLLCLTGCESLMYTDAEVQANRAELKARKAREEAQRRNNYYASLRGQCQNYGFQNGTSEMANCVQRLDMQKQEARQRRGHCNIARSVAMSQPTRSGSTGESFAMGNEAYSKCMAGQ